MLNDSTRVNSCESQKTEIPFALVPIGHDIPKLKCGLLKAYASLIGHSFETDGKRISYATNREIATHCGSTVRTVTRSIDQLAGLGLLKTEMSGRRRTIELTADFRSESWVKINLDDPCWKLPDLAFKVWFGLRRFKGRNHVVWMTDNTLASFLGLSATPLKSGLRALSAIGVIDSQKRWFGSGWSRRIYFPDPRQNRTIEDTQCPDPRQNRTIEDTTLCPGQNRASTLDKTGPHPRQNRTMTLDKTGPHPRQNRTIEDESEEEFLKEPDTHTREVSLARRDAHDGGGCVLGVKSPLGDQSQSQDVEDAIRRLKANPFTSSFQNPMLEVEVCRLIRGYWKKFGPLPIQFLESSLTTGINGKTLNIPSLVRVNLAKWGTYNEHERSLFSNYSKFERQTGLDRPEVISKVNGAKRVLCSDGQWRDKAAPIPNGASRPVHEVLAEMGLRGGAGETSKPEPVAKQEVKPVPSPEEIQRQKDRQREFELSRLDAHIEQEALQRASDFRRAEIKKYPSQADAMKALRPQSKAIDDDFRKRVREEYEPKRAAIIEKYPSDSKEKTSKKSADPLNSCLTTFNAFPAG